MKTLLNSKKAPLLAVCLTCLLALTACGQPSEIGKTAKPLEGGDVGGIGRDWEILCIGGIEYIWKGAGAYGGAITGRFQQDGTLHTCEG